MKAIERIARQKAAAERKAQVNAIPVWKRTALMRANFGQTPAILYHETLLDEFRDYRRRCSEQFYRRALADCGILTMTPATRPIVDCSYAAKEIVMELRSVRAMP